MGCGEVSTVLLGLGGGSEDVPIVHQWCTRQLRAIPAQRQVHNLSAQPCAQPRRTSFPALEWYGMQGLYAGERCGEIELHEDMNEQGWLGCSRSCLLLCYLCCLGLFCCTLCIFVVGELLQYENQSAEQKLKTKFKIVSCTAL